MKFLALVLLSMSASVANAGVTAWQGGAGEKAYIESSAAGGNTHYVKVESANSAWNDKVIKTRETRDYAQGQIAYVIDYEKKKGLNRKKEYGYVVGAGAALVKGSLVKTVSIFFPEKKKPYSLCIAKT